MLSTLMKTYYAEKKGLKPEEIYVVGIMPCVAKKFEASRPEHAMADDQLGRRDRAAVALLAGDGVVSGGGERKQDALLVQPGIDRDDPRAVDDEPRGGTAEQAAHFAKTSRPRHEDVVADAVTEKFGGDSVVEVRRNVRAYLATLADTLPLAGDLLDPIGPASGSR